MVRKAFKMKLYDGMIEEYEKRHNAVHAEVIEMIHNYGGGNYSIFYDKETNYLFGYIEIEDEKRWQESRKTAACHNWWDFMADIMETNENNSPVSVPLRSVYLRSYRR